MNCWSHGSTALRKFNVIGFSDGARATHQPVSRVKLHRQLTIAQHPGRTPRCARDCPAPAINEGSEASGGSFPLLVSHHFSALWGTNEVFWEGLNLGVWRSRERSCTSAGGTFVPNTQICNLRDQILPTIFLRGPFSQEPRKVHIFWPDTGPPPIEGGKEDPRVLSSSLPPCVTFGNCSRPRQPLQTVHRAHRHHRLRST